METRLILETVGFGLGLLGAVLGVINTWRALDRDRVKLRVTAHPVFNSPGHHTAIVVVNLSSFPVQIKTVGFTVKHNRGKWFYFPPTFAEPADGKLPHFLESRAALTVFVPDSVEDNPVWPRISRPLATTVCGHLAVGARFSVRDHHQPKVATAAAESAAEEGELF